MTFRSVLGTYATATTSTGGYSVALPRTHYEAIVAHADGYSESRQVPESLSWTDKLDFVLTPEACVDGAVIDRATRQPVAEVVVAGSATIMRTNATGRFRACGLRPGSVRLSVDEPRWRGSLVIEVGAADRHRGVELLVDGAHCVSGRVTSADGRPLSAPHSVRVSARTGERSEVRHDSVGPDGTFKLCGVLPGNWKMGATRHRYQPEFADLTNSVAVIDRDVVGIELALRPPARLEGIVRNARGEPVRDAAIHSGWPAGGDGPTVWTDATGRYVIEDLDPGPIEVRVVDVGLVKAILEPGKTTRVEHSVRWP